MNCWFAHLGDCDGALIRAHLLPRQLLRREFPLGVVLERGVWRKLTRYEDRYELEARSLNVLIADPRSWVPMCGGPMGNGGHHGRFDQSRTLRIARADLPSGVVEFAAELGSTWFLDREYGMKEEVT